MARSRSSVEMGVRAAALLLFLSVCTARAAPGLVLQTNQQAPVTNLQACAWHPYVAPALRLTGAEATASDPPLDYASVTVMSGNAGNDSLRLDPDPAAPCSWGAPVGGSGVLGGPQTCGPCPPLSLALTGAPPSNASVLTLTGVAPASVFQGCLRRLTLSSVAYGGEEGPEGPRTLTFAARRQGAAAGDNAADTARVVWVPAVDNPPLATPAPDTGGGSAGAPLTCSDLLPQGPRLTTPPEPPGGGGGPLYEPGCVRAPDGSPGPCAGGGYFTLLQPALAVTVPPGATEPPFLQYATVTLGWKRVPGVQARGQVGCGGCAASAAVTSGAGRAACGGRGATVAPLTFCRRNHPTTGPSVGGARGARREPEHAVPGADAV